MRSRKSAFLPKQSVSTTDSNLTLFAWNGVAFQVPKRWELSVNELVKGVSRIVLEDDFGPRLELDWTKPRSASETERFRKRSLEYIKIIDEKSRSVTPLAALPDEWTAHLYRMSDDSFLATAYMVPPSSDAGTPGNLLPPNSQVLLLESARPFSLGLLRHPFHA